MFPTAAEFAAKPLAQKMKDPRGWMNMVGQFGIEFEFAEHCLFQRLTPLSRPQKHSGGISCIFITRSPVVLPPSLPVFHSF